MHGAPQRQNLGQETRRDGIKKTGPIANALPGLCAYHLARGCRTVLIRPPGRLCNSGASRPDKHCQAARIAQPPRNMAAMRRVLHLVLVVVLVSNMLAFVRARDLLDLPTVSSDLAAAVPLPFSGDCHAALTHYRSARPVHQPLQNDLPEHLVAAFTLNGSVPLARFLVDDTHNNQGSHYHFARKDIEELVSAAQMLRPAAMRNLNERWAAEALRNLQPQIRERSVLVFGSMEPWWEAVLLALGARHVTVLEYNTLTYEHAQLTTVLPRDLPEPPARFDIALSLSSFDHDGLGRYGDPLDPEGDLKAMQVARCLLAPGGLLVLSVPVGPDIVVYNLHRRYGPQRLPLLLRGFQAIHTTGWNSAMLHTERDYRRSYEPILVLRSTDPTDDYRSASAKSEL